MEENVPCVSNTVKNIIFHALSWKVRKNMDNFDKKFLEIEPGSIAWILFLSKLLSYPFVS